MAVSRLRRWWGSRRLLPFAAGLTLLAMTAGAGSGISTAATPGLSGGTTVTMVSAPGPHAVPGALTTDLNAAVHTATPDGRTASVATGHDSRGDVAPCGVLCDRPAVDGSARQTAAPTDVPAPRGVAHAPRGPRAPPLHLA